MSAAGNAIPSVWYDEAASIGAATRDWSALGGLLSHLDAVHGAYYVLLHLWFDLVGYSPFLLRLPSALAIGGTVALLAVLADGLAGRRAAWTTAAVATLLPSLTWAGGEGRSSALTALAATASTTALVHALRLRPATPRAALAWAGYAGITAIGGVLFVYSLLLLPAHLLTLLIRARRSPTSVRPFLAAAAAVVAPTVPLLLLAAGQRGQIAWIPPLAPRTVGFVLQNQWFGGALLHAAVAWSVLVVVAVRALRRPTPQLLRAPLTAATLAVPWAAVPTVGLLVASLVQPTYLPRYLTFTAPAIALLLGAALARTGSRGVLVVALLGALAVPNLVASRSPQSKLGSVWADTAAVLEERRAGDPSGAIVYGRLADHATATTDVVAVAYPKAFHGLRDVTARGPAAASTALWQQRIPLPDALPELRGQRTVWLLTDVRTGDRDRAAVALGSIGLAPVGEQRLAELRLERFERPAPGASSG